MKWTLLDESDWHFSLCLRVPQSLCKNLQDLIVAQGLSGRAAIPAAVWYFPIGRDNVEGVVDEVVLQDSVVGCAGGQRGRGVDLERKAVREKDKVVDKNRAGNRLCCTPG